MDNIKIIRLLTGEELIGEVGINDMDLVTLKDVAVIQMIPLQNGNVTITLMPFAPYSEDETFTLNPQHVTMSYKPATELLNKYNSIYGSGIQIASASSIIQ